MKQTADYTAPLSACIARDFGVYNIKSVKLIAALTTFKVVLQIKKIYFFTASEK